MIADMEEISKLHEGLAFELEDYYLVLYNIAYPNRPPPTMAMAEMI